MSLLKKIFTKDRMKILIIIFIVLIILSIITLIFLKNNYKNINLGNNNLNKTLDEVEKYICNISSYDALIEVTINSNKNTNKYIMKQKHSENNEDEQEILEPKNVEGVKIIYKNNTLEIQNTKLQLIKSFNNYPYITDNCLWLNSFISEYKEASTNNKIISENEEEIIITIKNSKNESTKDIKQKELYLNKKTGKPTKMLIKNTNNQTIIYILYNEITIN